MDKVAAYTLINVKIGKTKDVIEALKNIEEIKNIAATTGIYDIIIRVEAEDHKHLFEVLNKVHQIDGIERTTTHVIEVVVP